MKTLGIDFGSSHIKVIEIQQTSRGIQITQFFEHKLNQAANADHSLETIEYLRKLLSNYDPTQVKVCIGLRQDRVAIRYKFFPFSDRLKIYKSLPFELEEDIPFSPENAIFDSKIVKTIGAGAEVLACAAPHTQIEKALQLAQDCGFQASLLSDEGLAFANLVENWQGAPPALPPPAPIEYETQIIQTKKIEVILNMGHSRTLVCAFENKRLIAVRSILWGSKNISEALARKYQIPAIEASKELENKGFILTNKTGASFDQVTFSDTIANSVKEMVRDLRLTLLEIRSEFDAEPTQLLMTGGTSLIKNLGPFMTQQLELPVNSFDSLAQFPQALIGRDPKTTAKVGTALALALEGFKKPRNPAINFLREEFAPQNHTFKNFVEKWGVSLKYASFLFVAFFIYAFVREEISLSLTETAQEAIKSQARTVAGLSGRQANERGVRQYIRSKQSAARNFQQLEGLVGINSGLDILSKISKSLPQRSQIGLDFKEFALKDSQLKVQGYTNSPREVDLIANALKSVATSGQVNKTQSSLPSLSNRTSFSFELQVDREVKGAQ